MILEKLHRTINNFNKTFNWRRFRRDALHLGESLLVFGVLYGIFSTLIWGVCWMFKINYNPDLIAVAWQCRCCWTLWSTRLMTGTMKSGTGIERWERPMDEATRISLKDQFNSLLVRAIEGRRGGMALMRVLEELDFYNSPASAKHHLNVPGGLVLHSLNVARAALELVRQDAAVCKMQ